MTYAPQSWIFILKGLYNNLPWVTMKGILWFTNRAVANGSIPFFVLKLAHNKGSIDVSACFSGRNRLVCLDVVDG
jgi:hypothetical protein